MDGSNHKSDVGSLSVRPKIRTLKSPESEVFVGIVGALFNRFRSQELSGDSVDKKCVKIIDNDGNQHSYPALHQRFADCLVYVKYYTPPKKPDGTLADPQSKEMYDWLEMVYTYEQNLRTILRLPFHRFWATVIHEKGFHLMLESYLLNAPRFYDSLSLLMTEQMKESINEIHKLVLKVHLRMSNFKESKKDHLTPQVFGQIIYDHYVFDTPKLMDLCTLYGNTSQQINEKLYKMIETVFKYQKAYTDDLQSAVLSLMSNLQHMQQQFEASYNEMPLNASNVPKLKSIKWSELQETIYFMTDVAVTGSMFVSIYPPSAKLLHKHKFENLIVGFYENVFPSLKDELESRFEQYAEARQVSQEVVRQLTICRHYLIKCFRDITVLSCFQALFDSSVDVNTKTLLIDDYLELISVALSEKCFAGDYFNRYPFLADLSALMENAELTGFQNVDQSRIDYLLNTTNYNETGVARNANENGHKTQPNGDAGVVYSRAVEVNTQIPQCVERPQEIVDGRCDKESVEFEDQDTIDKAALESCITNITDIFPDLGHGFIEACLEFYNNDVEKVVDALLTSSLPESIDKLDRNLKCKPKKKQRIENDNINVKRELHSESEELTNLKRLLQKKLEKENVPVAVYSKKPEPLQSIDEKTKAYVKLAAVRIEEDYLRENEYDDEYDDTYDTVDPKVEDNDSKLNTESEVKRNNYRR